MDTASSCIEGVRRCSWKTFSDHRGELGVVELEQEFGFNAKRLFYISVQSEGVVRAEHAVSAVQVLLLLAGAVIVDVNNGRETASLALSGSDNGLVIGAGVWRKLRDFEPGTLLLVAASQSYSETVESRTPFFDLSVYA